MTEDNFDYVNIENSWHKPRNKQTKKKKIKSKQINTI